MVDIDYNQVVGEQVGGMYCYCVGARVEDHRVIVRGLAVWKHIRRMHLHVILSRRWRQIVMGRRNRFFRVHWCVGHWRVGRDRTMSTMKLLDIRFRWEIL
jgi:hypothetical protein